MVVGYRFLVFGCGLLIGCYYITNNQIPTTYYPKLFLYFSLLIFYTSPRQWGLRGDLLLAKDEIVISCLLESWYCLPDSHLLHICNPETTSRVTLASLGTVFQTDSDWTKEISMLMMLFSGFVVLLFSDFVECINNAIN